ncbi:MAG TPA: hypothetical protein VNN55_09275 [bacterium]|nr:hypothetical protein [bacterium]
MKRTFVLMVALVLIVPVAVMAGDYHKGVTLNCSECHVMHGSQQHGYNADGSGVFTPIGGAPPYQYLLRNEINALCLTCHNNQTFAPDVLEANGGTAPTTGRQGGALNMNNTAPYFASTGHTLGSHDVAPGGTFSNPHGLECVDCHQPHGRSSGTNTNPYRNLGNYDATHTVYTAYMTYAIGTNDLTKDVFERTASGSDHYDIGNVDFNEPNVTGSRYGDFCKSCHTNFHGNSTDAHMANADGWLRHPAAEANISISTFGARLYRPKVMSATGDWGTQGTAFTTGPTDLTPSCFSCHRAHGNTNSFGIILQDGLSTIGEDGTAGATMRTTCRTCHRQGS